MNISENDRKIAAFIKMISSHICNEVSGNQETFNIRVVFYDFIKIYSDANYRHSYNQIFIALKQIKDSNKTSDESFMMNINANYEYIVDMLLPPLKEHDYHRYKKIVKFFDHLLLELSRLDVWLEYERDTANQQKRFDSQTEKIKQFQNQMDNIINDTKTKISDIQDKTNNIKTDFVTILSIFAAIIIGFAGVLGFGGNIMANLNNVVIYKAIVMMLISGLVLFNGIFVMLHIVAKLTGHSIAHHCIEHTHFIQNNLNSDSILGSHSQYSCDTCQNKECNFLRKLHQRFPYTTYFNKIFAYTLIFTLITWTLNHGELGKAVTNDLIFLINYSHVLFYIGLGLLFIIVVKILYKWNS